MRRPKPLTAVMLIAAIFLAAALYDTAAIITRPLWPHLNWMLP